MTGRKIRIGFVSALLREHTVGRYFMRWITDLDRNRFDVWLYSLAAGVDAITASIAGRADHVRTFVGGEGYTIDNCAANPVRPARYPGIS